MTIFLAAVWPIAWLAAVEAGRLTPLTHLLRWKWRPECKYQHIGVNFNKKTQNISVHPNLETQVIILLTQNIDLTGTIKGTVYDESDDPITKAFISMT